MNIKKRRVSHHNYIRSFFEVCETITNNNKRYYIVNTLTGDVIMNSDSPIIISNWFNLLKC
nr:MAG TPA: hypothetical protein [Caudoviricetes sp.]